MKKLLQMDQLLNWLENGFTKNVLETFKEIKEKKKEEINSYILYSKSLNEIDLSLIAELKGQVNFIETILDIKQFCLNNEIIKEERSDVRRSWAENKD